MSWDVHIQTALLRAAVTATLCVIYAWTVLPLLRSSRLRGRHVAWVMLLLPFLTPVVLSGYVYSGTAVMRQSMAGWREVLYVTVLASRLAPFAAVLLLCYRPPESADARYCRRLSLRGWRRLWFIWPRGWIAGLVSAFGLVFLLSFSELELASLLMVDSWTVTLFDAQVGGLAMRRSLLRAVIPSVLQVFILLISIILMFRARLRLPDQFERHHESRWRRRLGWLCLLMSVGVGSAFPVSLVLRESWGGLASVLRHPSLMRTIGIGVFIGACASALAFWWALQVTDDLVHGRWAALTPVLPGLLGALTLALVCTALLTLPGLRSLRSTPVPAVVCLAGLLLPYALLLALVRLCSREPVALHSVSLLDGSPDEPVRREASRQRRHMLWRGAVASALLLFWVAYFELTAVAILSPPGFTPVSVRLYNLVHYGQTPALSAMIAVACAAPLSLWLLVTALSRRICSVRGGADG